MTRPGKRERPVIGLTMDSGNAKPGTVADRYGLNADYAACVERAGGLPLAIPYQIDHALIPQIVDLLDGILFIGGDDMDPARYGDREWHDKAVKMDPRRQAFEFALIAEVERRRLPALGICFGSQLMNVHRGGSLHQFLPDVPRPSALEHRKLGGDAPRHPVRVEPGSHLGSALGKPDVLANSYHKQAVKELGRGLRVVATAPDGVIEAFEDPSLPLFAAVQWHPERLGDEPEHQALFKLLVDRAAGR